MRLVWTCILVCKVNQDRHLHKAEEGEDIQVRHRRLKIVLLILDFDVSMDPYSVHLGVESSNDATSANETLPALHVSDDRRIVGIITGVGSPQRLMKPQRGAEHGGPLVFADKFDIKSIAYYI